MSKPKSVEELWAGLENPALSSEAKKSKRLRTKRIAAGLCCYCGKNPPADGTRACVKCKVKYWVPRDHRKHSFEWRQRMIASGLCSHCGKNPPLQDRKLCEICRKYFKERTAGHYTDNKEAWSRRNKASLRKLKMEVFNAYGGPTCNCCGEKEFLFLSLDHIDNDGSKHRMSIFGEGRYTGGRRTYAWAKVNGFPKIFQVLCMNCNWGKHANGGVCPHNQ